MDVYIHSKNDLKNSVLKYILCLIPLYLYGFYKNGILLYNKDLIDFFAMFKIFYLLFLGLGAYVLVNAVFKNKLKIDTELLVIFIVPLFMMPNTNYLIYFGGMVFGLILFKILAKKFNINISILLILLIILGQLILKNYGYQNIAEDLNLYAFSSFDLLWGRGSGGIGSTNIIFLLLIMLFLSFKTIYKYQVALSSLLIYCILSLVFGFYTFLFNGNAIAAFILLATDSISSPVEGKNKIIYGLLVGILGFILTNFVSFYTGAFLSILIVSIIWNFICQITKKVL